MTEKIVIISIVLLIIEFLYFIHKYFDDKNNGKKVSIFDTVIKIIGIGGMIFMGAGLYLIFYFIYWCGNQF